MLKIRILCGLAVVVCAMSAVASPASAAFKQFKGGEGKVSKSSEQVFAVATGVEVKCLSVTGSAAIEKGNTAQVKTKTINYENCTLGGLAAVVTGCSYNFHINGSATVEGNNCEVNGGSGACVLKIENANNKELKELTYTDTGKGSIISSELKSNIAGITVAGSGKSALCALKTKVATYKGTIGVEGIGVA